MSPRISIVMPYWMRQGPAERGIESLAHCYPRMDLEVVVVDDGSPEPFRAPDAPWPIRVITLQGKTEPKNPCVPFNAGVAAASADIICLTNPEIIHEAPIIETMMADLERGGERTYVAASVWGPDENRWHIHPDKEKFPKEFRVAGISMPCGFPFHFFAMLRRGLWNEVGGSDERYRDGAGYDDNDLALSLHAAGANVIFRGDIRVIHPRKNARATFTPRMFEHNRRLFVHKWKHLEIANGRR